MPRRRILVEQVGKILPKLIYLKIRRHDEIGWSALTLIAKIERPPGASGASDCNECAEYIEFELVHDLYLTARVLSMKMYSPLLRSATCKDHPPLTALL